MTKYGTIKTYVPMAEFNFFNNFSAQKRIEKTITINDVGSDWFDCLTDDEQNYVLQMPKYSHLDYDGVVKQYDQDVLPTVIKKERSKGWDMNKQGNIIGFIKK
jgi:hypothetical protein